MTGAARRSEVRMPFRSRLIFLSIRRGTSAKLKLRLRPLRSERVRVKRPFPPVRRHSALGIPGRERTFEIAQFRVL